MIEKIINSLDTKNMYKSLCDFPEQITKSIKLIENTSIKPRANISNILICGMGGSAIGGDVVKTILSDSLDYPIFINRDYGIPKWVNKSTLIILSSFSGNTDEVISCLNDCLEYEPLIISTGGKLIKEAKAKKWIEENKPKLLKKVKAKLKEYDNKIKEINDDFNQLDTTLKQYVSTFNYALDGVEETFNITGNKANKDIKNNLKELRQKKKLHLNEAQQKIFDTKFNDIRKRLGTLKDLTNYQNITKLIENINSVTKSKNKIKGYEEDFDSLKSEKLETEKIELDIAKLNDEITKEKNNIDTVISLKEEIDALDNELSEKSIFDDITKIAIYVIIFLLILGLIVYLILQNRKMNKMNLTSKKSTESKFDRLEDRIRESTASMQRAQQIRSKQETTLSSQPKEQPKTAEEITIGKYEEMMNNYKEALDNFSKVAAFKQKWNGLALTRKERQDGTKTILINSSRAFEKSEIWCVNFDDKYFALPGSSVKSNMAAYMNLDFEKAQRDFKGVFSISSGSSYFTEVCLLRRGGAGFVVERIGKLQFPQ